MHLIFSLDSVILITQNPYNNMGWDPLTTVKNNCKIRQVKCNLLHVYDIHEKW